MSVQTATSLDADQGYILPPSKTEFTSTKLQMTIGIFLIVVVCFLNYFPILHTGLLLDDFNNVDYVYRAWHGAPHDFLANFYSNWAQLDVMKAYRPFVSLSFFTDYALFGLNYIGYHLTNVLLFTICAIFVSLIALELTGIYGNRSRASVAIWAGLLFAADPLHVESVTWIIGRVDLLCCVFYFASVFCFMRFRLLRERTYLIASLITFFISLGSKEMAVTLPLVQTLICILPIETPKVPGQTLARRLVNSDLKYALLFYFELAAFSVMRVAFLGPTIGGYGHTDSSTVLNAWRNFADRASIYKIFLPVNEELHFNQKLIQACWAGFIMILAAGMSRIFLSRKIVAPLTFLLLWSVLAVLPTFQIWHIFPNLVGSRLFFTSSAPLCIALALCALPATDAIGHFATKLWTYFGAVALVIVFVCWSYILQENLKPWLTAASQMQTFRQELAKFASDLAPGQKVLLLNLPPDYQGAGMVTRSWYVEQICRPPFTATDTSKRFVSIEPVVSGSHEFLWPTELANLLQDKTIPIKVIWNPVKGEFESFTNKISSFTKRIPVKVIWNPVKGEFESFTITSAPSSATIIANNFLGSTIEPASAWTGLDKEWRLQSDRVPGMEIHSDFRRLYPARIAPKKGAPPVMTFWLPVHGINPIRQNYARIAIKVTGGDGNLDKCRFVWKSKGLNLPNQIEHEAIIQRDKNGAFYVWLGRYRGWTLNDPPTAVGLRLPAGDYCVDLKNIEFCSDKTFKPTIAIDGAEYTTPATIVRPKSALTKIRWQANLPEAASVVLRVSRPNLVFDPNSELDVLSGPPGNLAAEIPCSTTTGTISLTELKLQEGTTQVQVVAKDRDGNTVGLPSEPVSIKLDNIKSYFGG
jgi:hypothetical protein